MTCHVVTALVVTAWLAACACGDSSASQAPVPSVSPSPLPGPAPGASLSGVVSAAGTTTRISGAHVSMLDGPNAGRTTTTTNGEYLLAELQPGNATVSVTATGHLESRAGVFIEGATRLDIQLAEASPLVAFGPGQHRVGAGIAPGRYFSDPASGCYWERQSGTSGTAAETIAFGLIGFDAAQWVVDIRPTDHAFQTNEACGTWSNRVRGELQPAITAGAWLVGPQVLPGTYSSSVRAGCYWERLRDFAGEADSVIASELIATAGAAFVTIFAGDAGFRSDATCGSWVRAEPDTASSSQQAPAAR